MALRVKEVDIAGRKFTIGLPFLAAVREYGEGLDAILKKKDGAPTSIDAALAYVVASLIRSDPSYTSERLRAEVDEYELCELARAVSEFRGAVFESETPADPPPSP